MWLENNLRRAAVPSAASCAASVPSRPLLVQPECPTCRLGLPFFFGCALEGDENHISVQHNMTKLCNCFCGFSRGYRIAWSQSWIICRPQKLDFWRICFEKNEMFAFRLHFWKTKCSFFACNFPPALPLILHGHFSVDLSRRWKGFFFEPKTFF